MPTSVGDLVPLTLERFRIFELYAELLHCSNMSLLNRRRGFGPTYDEQGRLTGGLDALEQLARVIDPNISSESMMDQSIDSDTARDSKELLVSSASTGSSSIISDDGVSVDDEQGELDSQLGDSALLGSSPKAASEQMYGSSGSVMPTTGPMANSSAENLDPFSDPEPTIASSDISTPGTEVSSSNTSTVRHSPISEHFSPVVDRSAFEPSGDILKQRMIDLNIVSTILVSIYSLSW